MRKKAKTPGSYPTFGSFDRDATLVFDNCMAFNAPGTPFHGGADRMKRQWAKFKAKFRDVDIKAAADRTRVRKKVMMNGMDGWMEWMLLAALCSRGRACTALHCTALTDPRGVWWYLHIHAKADALGAGAATAGPAAGGGIGRGRSSSSAAGAVPLDAMKDPHTPQPLNARARVEGANNMFGHALLLLADPFVVLVLLRTLARRMDECFAARAVPKDHPLIPSLLQLLHLGLSARRQLTRVLRYKPPPPSAQPAAPPPPTTTSGPGHQRRGASSSLPSLPPVEPPPGYTIPSASVAALTGPPGKDGEPTAAGDAEEALRSVLPGLLELNAYVAVVRRYETAPGGWEGQPHDRESVNEKMLEAVGRLYRCCRAWAPAPLPLRLLQQALATSAAHASDDAKTTPLAKTLLALYDHNHRRKRAEALAAAPDLQDRFLWHSLATACVRRTAGPPKPRAATTTAAATTAPAPRPKPQPLDAELRDLLLSLFTKQLPLSPPPRALSACHAQLARLLAEWAGPRGNGVLKAAGAGAGGDGGNGDGDGQQQQKVIHAPLLRVVAEAVAAVGGVQAFRDLWEDVRFAAIRRAYDRLMERVPAVRPLVLGEAVGEGGKAEEGEAMDVAAT